MPPPDREALELLLGVDRQIQRRGDVVEVAAPVHCGERGADGRVDHHIGAARGRQRAPARRVVARHDVAHALRLQQQDHRQADRPAADHDRDRPLADVRAAHGMPADRHRLGECGDVGVQAVGHGHHQRLLHEHLLGVGAGGIGRQADHVDTAGVTQERERDDPRAAGRRLATTGPVLGDLTAELVSEHDRLLGAREAVIPHAHGKLGPLIASVTGVKVRAADPTAQHLQAHLPLAGHRLGSLDDVELCVSADNRLHRRTGFLRGPGPARFSPSRDRAVKRRPAQPPARWRSA